MKDLADSSTIDLFPKKSRGRPVTGAAQSNAERQRAYRQRAKLISQTDLSITIDQVTFDEFQRLKALNEVIGRTLVQLQKSEREYIERVHSLETTNKALSTKLKKANEDLKTHKCLLEKTQIESAKYDSKWLFIN